MHDDLDPVADELLTGARARRKARPPVCDVIAHPSPAGVAHRYAQLERDRAAELARLELEQLVPVSPPPPPRPPVS